MHKNESPFESFSDFEKNDTNEILIRLITKCGTKNAELRISIDEVIIV